MKKYLFFAAALLCATAADAKVWRINYDDNAQADFKTIALCQAWNGFTEGDTLYMEPGFHNGSTADNYIKKSCTVVGSGWGFQTSTNTVSETESAIFSSAIYMNNNLSVKLIGLYCNSIIVNNNYDLVNLTIEKCRFTSTYSATFGGLKVQNLEVKNCFVEGDLSIKSTANAIITGNIIRVMELCTPSNRCIVDHNTIMGVYSASSSTRAGYSIVEMNNKVSLTNNIIINPSYSAQVIKNLSSSYSMYNNVFSITPEDVQAAEYTGETTYDIIKDNNQLIGATAANTFVRALGEGIVDNAMYYYVKDDAVAKTADSKGGECGAFGGDYPYQLNGRPNGVPYLYDIVVPTHTDNNQLKISFKVAGNNE